MVDVMEADAICEFEQQLERHLSGALPGPMVQRQLAPELAFGRHRGPAPRGTRQASVLMLIHPGRDGWVIPAIVRPTHMKYHPGQIALPGGMVEPGETGEQAALREFEEELGVSAAEVRVLGQLTPLYVYVSQTQVSPFVAFTAAQPAWKPNPAEVAGVVNIGLQEFLSPAARGSHVLRRRGWSLRAPHFEIAGQHIWGATAMVLAEFAAVCSAARLHLPAP